MKNQKPHQWWKHIFCRWLLYSIALTALTASSASAQANVPRLENALPAAFYCYDASRETVKAPVSQLRADIAKDIERIYFRACLKRFNAGQCTTDAECETFFGGSY
jgi:hypothetical protein